MYYYNLVKNKKKKAPTGLNTLLNHYPLWIKINRYWVVETRHSLLVRKNLNIKDYAQAAWIVCYAIKSCQLPFGPQIFHIDKQNRLALDRVK